MTLGTWQSKINSIWIHLEISRWSFAAQQDMDTVWTRSLAPMQAFLVTSRHRQQGFVYLIDGIDWEITMSTAIFLPKTKQNKQNTCVTMKKYNASLRESPKSVCVFHYYLTVNFHLWGNIQRSIWGKKTCFLHFIFNWHKE